MNANIVLNAYWAALARAHRTDKRPVWRKTPIVVRRATVRGHTAALRRARYDDE